jgi:hypothetical protein
MLQVDPMTPKLKSPGTKRLKVKCGILLSNSAFKFNLRRYIMAHKAGPDAYCSPRYRHAFQTLVS